MSQRTFQALPGGAISSRIRGALNIDAIGKPFIATKAVDAARAVPVWI